jgi:hypothetical protein
VAAEPVEPDPRTIRRILDTLVHERQRLRHVGVDGPELEANRLAIAYWHRALGAAEASGAGGRGAPQRS